MKYLFKTDTVSKNKKYWIDRNIVGDLYINADNLKDAIKQYVELVENEKFITFSKSAIKNKKPIYIDKEGKSLQVGYAVTGKTECFDDLELKDKTFYVELWVEIFEIARPKF